MKIHLGTLSIASPAFKHGDRIPEDNANHDKPVSPALEWSGAPENTKSFALVVHDPDAPLTYGFTHWVIYGIPASATGLPAGGGDDYVKGANGMGGGDYMPPGPPPGHGDHYYYFELYVLDDELDLAPGLDRRALLEAIDDHIIEQARIVGTYSN